jgi:tetratricopeptide (TPR) repeat protein
MNARFAFLALSLLSGALGAPTALARQAPVANAEVDAPILPLDATDISATQVDAYLAKIRDGNAAEVIKELEKHPLLKTTHRKVEVIYGTALYFAGRVREASNIAIKHKSATQKDPIVLRFVGYAFLGIEDPSTAESFFKLATVWDKDDVEAQFNLARCRALLKTDEASIAALRAFEPQANKLPKDQFNTVVSDMLVRFARARMLQGKRGDDTIALLRDAAALRPSSIDPEELIAAIYVESGDYAKARAALSELEKKFDGQLDRVMFLRARIHEKQGEWKPAKAAAFDAATLSDWTHLPSLLLAARASMQLGDYDDARRPLDKALVVAPSDYDARIAMAQYLMYRVDNAKTNDERLEYMKQCEVHCFQAVGINQIDAQVFEILVDLYTKWGDTKKSRLDAAKQDLDRARAIAAKQAETGN